MKLGSRGECAWALWVHSSLQETYALVGLHTFDFTPTTFLVKSHAHRSEVRRVCVVVPTRTSTYAAIFTVHACRPRLGLAIVRRAPLAQATTDWKNFERHFKRLRAQKPCEERMPLKHCKRNIWIVKPSGLNCGRGIAVFDDLHQMRQYLFTVNGTQEYLVQKCVRVLQCVGNIGIVDGFVGGAANASRYIERPLLLRGRKFDIRLWALVDDAFNVWVYRDGCVAALQGRLLFE